MTKHQKSATIVGSLFLTALILNLVATEIFHPILNSADYLAKVYPSRNLIVVGNLLNIICGIAMIFIPISLFPVIPTQERTLAVCYLVLRSIEGMLFLFLAIKSLTFISLSKAYVHQAYDDISVLAALGDFIYAEIHWATIADILIFSVGGLTFYSLLYRTKLLPRFLSVWGLAAIFLLLVGVIMGMFGWGVFESMPLMAGMGYFAPPIALNELVLSLWLIFKGYHSSVQKTNIDKTRIMTNT